MARDHTLQGAERRAAALLLAPSLTGTTLFLLLPFAETVRRSLFDGRGIRFVGLTNYRAVVENTAFRMAVANTARFIAVCLPLLLGISLLLALGIRALRTPHREGGGRVFKTTFLLPMGIPVASIVLLWQVLFAKAGIFNTFLVSLGKNPVDFMGTGAAFWVLIATYLWKNTGYDMILWLAGRDAIPQDLYEAAAVDGANGWQAFRWITVPNLMPTFVLVTILSLLNCFKAFREAYLVAGAYPHQSIYQLQHLFNNWFLQLDLARLSAAAVMVAGALLVLILLVQKIRTGEET